MKNIENILNKFNGNKKAMVSYFLIEKSIGGIIELIKENINNTSLLEYIINEIIKEDEDLFYKIDNELKLIETNEKIIIKVSLENNTNLLKYSNHKNSINRIINNDSNINDIFNEINDIDTLDYLINSSLFKDTNILEQINDYDGIKSAKKDVLDNFFLKNTKKEINKLPINKILKSVRNKEDIIYKGENKILNDLNSSLKEFKSSIYKNDYKNDISYQFLNQNSDYLESEIFILTDNKNKEIYVNFINHNDNLTSKVFENSGIQYKRSSNYLNKIEKQLTKKIEEIESGYKVTLNSFIFKKGEESIENNIFNIELENDCILMMAIKLSEDANNELDSCFKGFIDMMKEKERKAKSNNKL